MSAKDKDSIAGASAGANRWVGYRPEIKVVDCTVRDGGLMNAHGFTDAVVRGVYQACVEGGIDYMEMGYKCSKRIFSKNEYGPWKFCDEEDLRRIVGTNETPLKLSVMADAERTDYPEDILPREDSVIDMIRVATYIHQIPTAVEMIMDAHDKGYETCANVMAISAVQERALDEALEALAQTPVGTIYLVDSFGALYSEQIDYFMRKYMNYAKEAGKEVGIHTHNNQMLGYSNTISAIIAGANMLDASISGLGRGAGNCPMELLLGFLHNPKFRIRPVLACIRDHIEPLRKEMQWGFDIPYMITGLLNQHPRSAMSFNAQDGVRDFVDFFDSMVEEE